MDNLVNPSYFWYFPETLPTPNVVDFNMGSSSMPNLGLASSNSVENPENMGGN